MTSTFDYQEYLASREWALLKNKIRERSRGMCERCGQAPHQSTHHKTYARIGHELLEDLLGVCNPCHEFLSGKRDDDPADPDEADEPKQVSTPGSPPLAEGPIEWADDCWFGEPVQQMACPVCRFEYVHIVGVRQHTTMGWANGGGFRAHFWCESSHHFTIEYGFHKGGVFVRYSPVWGAYWPSHADCKDCAELQ